MAIYNCRLRKYRKSAQVSQRETAFLVGLRSQGVLSEIESGRKRPSARVALACAAAFNVPLHELFPSLHAEAEHDVLAHALRLHAELASNEARAAATAYLAALISRLGGTYPPV